MGIDDKSIEERKLGFVNNRIRDLTQKLHKRESYLNKLKQQQNHNKFKQQHDEALLRKT